MSQPQCAVQGFLDARKAGKAWRAPIVTGKDFKEKYELRGHLGKGGYAVVYLAVCKETATSVAIKLIDRDELSRRGKYTPTAVYRELDIMRQTSHPLIVQLIEVYDGGARGPGVGPMALVMELLRGTDVQKMLMDRGALPEPVSRAIFVQTAVALKHLHNRGIVHRDVKPGNTMVLDDISESGTAAAGGGGAGGNDGLGLRGPDGWRQPWPQAKLLDLGLARIVPVALPPPGSEAAPSRPASLMRRLRGRSGSGSLDGSKNGSLLMDNSKNGSMMMDGSKNGSLVMDGSKNGSVLTDASKTGGYFSDGSTHRITAAPPAGGAEQLGAPGRGAVSAIDAAIDAPLPAEAAAGALGGGGGREDASGRSNNSRRGLKGNKTSGRKKSSRGKLMLLSDMSASRRKLSMSAVGTRAFAPPEMFAMDHKSGSFRTQTPYGMNVDEYSLGSMLRYMLTGCPPDRTVADYKASRPGGCLSCLGGAIGGPPIKFLSEASPEAQDLCLALTDRNPDTRMGLSQALLHPWVLRGNYGPLDALIVGFPAAADAIPSIEPAFAAGSPAVGSMAAGATAKGDDMPRIGLPSTLPEISEGTALAASVRESAQEESSAAAPTVATVAAAGTALAASSGSI